MQKRLASLGATPTGSTPEQLAVKPPEQSTPAKPNPPANESNPSPQVAAANPGESKDAAKPVGPMASRNLNEPKDSGTAANPQAGTNSADAKRDPATSNSRPRPRNSAARVVQTQAPPSATPATTGQNTPPHQPVVEILLANGRMIRVDANIDPVLLARLITALDGK